MLVDSPLAKTYEVKKIPQELGSTVNLTYILRWGRGRDEILQHVVRCFFAAFFLKAVFRLWIPAFVEHYQ